MLENDLITKILILALGVPPSFSLLAVLIRAVPKMINKSFLYCVHCNAGKFEFTPLKEQDFFCKKCHESLEKLEIPGDLFKMRVYYIRMVVSLFVPFLISLFLALIEVPFAAIFVFGFTFSMLVVGIVLELKSRRQILNWAKKSN